MLSRNISCPVTSAKPPKHILLAVDRLESPWRHTSILRQKIV